MYDHREKLRQLRMQVASAEYDVDPGAVADAIIRRRWVVAVGREPSGVPSIASRRSGHARVSSVERALAA